MEAGDYSYWENVRSNVGSAEILQETAGNWEESGEAVPGPFLETRGLLGDHACVTFCVPGRMNLIAVHVHSEWQGDVKSADLL